MIASPTRVAALLCGIFLALVPAPLAAQNHVRKWTDVRNNITGGGEEELYSRMTLDPAGNVFTAGKTYDWRTRECVVRKVSASGSPVWEKRFVIAGSTSQSVIGLATDSGGNLFMTGTVYSGGSNYADCYVAKFAASDGNLLWQRRYNGPANLSDIPTEIAIDPSGDAVVLGTSDNGAGPSINGYADIHVLKLAGTSGATRWEKRVGGPIRSASGRDLAIRPSGNIVVAGQVARGVGLGGDLYVAECVSATGATVWENTYNSPSNATEQVADIALDPSGGVALTGFAEILTNGRREMLTLKYSSTGAFQWERRLTSETTGDKSGRNLAADSAGNFIVMGYVTPNVGSAAKQRYLAKYAAATGAVVWSTTDNSFEAIDAWELKRLVLDPSGNPCLTGNSSDTQGRQTFFTAKYSNSNGAKIWDNNYTWQTASSSFQIRHGGFFISMDPSGNPIAHGMSTNSTSGLDQFTIKYNSAGVRTWMDRFDGPRNREDGPGAVAIDAAGDVLTAGFELNPAGNNDIVVRKQNGKTGTPLWKFTYQGLVGMEDEGLAIATNSKGDAFVGGSTSWTVGGLSQSAIYFAKHAAANGSVIWQQPVTTPDNRYLELFGIATGPDDNPIVVLGGYLNNDEDLIVIKFSGASGAVLWRQSYSAPTMGGRNHHAVPRAMTLDAAGDLIVSVDAQETSNFTGDIRTVKFAGASGLRLWEAIYNGPGPNSDRVRGIAVDPAGNIAITGRHSTASGSVAMFTSRYRGTDGSLIWTKVYPGPENNSQGIAVAMDSAGNVIATGHSRERVLPVFAEDAYTVKYAAEDGAILWEKVYASTIGGDDLPEAVVVDSKGNVVIAGCTAEDTDGVNGDFSIFTAKYSGATGASLGSDIFAAHIENNDVPGGLGLRGMVIGAGDRIAVCGYSRPTLTDYDVVTLMYEPQQPKLVLEYPAGQALAANSTVDFGLVPGGMPSNFTFTLRNSGNADLALGQLGLTGETAAFELTPPASSTVLPAGTVTLSIRAQSEVVGTHNATLSILSNDPDANPFVVQLSFVTPSRNANLASLATDSGDFSPAFSSSGLSYRLTVPFATSAIRLTPVTEDERATVTAGGIPVLSGLASGPIPLAVGTTAVVTRVTAQDVRFTRDYGIQVTRLPEIITYLTGSEVPVSADGFVVGANRLDFALGYRPLPGSTLTVVQNTGLEFIEGRFSNLAQGQVLVLEHGGFSYRFVVNYYGGSGNDLVLQWADTSAAGWGANANGQLGEGDGTKAPWLLPARIEGLPDGVAVFSLAAGYLHSLSLASDGVISAWGSNSFGQLGDGTKLSRTEPAAVSNSGALAGKRVISIAAGAFHSLALCSDGTVYAWGYNNHGQLGNGNTTLATEPVPVDVSGVLAGKTVVAISAGAYHSLALCSDGSVAAWGFNGCGALGNGSLAGSAVPVSVLAVGDGPLRAKAVSAGQYHNLAIRDDGRLVAWGYNHRGQLGIGGTVNASSATAVNVDGVLAGRSAAAIAAGGFHSLALLDNGTLASWGLGADGQLGDGGSTDSALPVGVSAAGAIAGRQVVALGAGAGHCLALCSDATVAAWGGNLQGQLGTGNTDSNSVPQLVPALDGAGRFGTLARGSSSYHALVLLGLPLPPAAPGSLQDAGVGTPLPISEWRQQHFGTSDSAGEAADEMDPDHDGLVNLLEYAFALDPRMPDAARLPQHRIEGGYLVIDFEEPVGVTGLIYSASANRNLQQGVWLPLADEGVAPRHLFRIPIDQKAGFIRLEVRSP